ncbi:hypothetical protein [Neptunomonas antarctica]|uniref:PsiF repeat-containing protein n=1 Tax=Neptunomonas antarctica TaxID=619304 RepID=A0A1N7KZQ0_9GAMM|nr:hypothetical protein [Neptunomonas antarctica]SIS67017.1 hypothetical protein SAMN05421760_10397 [Neptunomonas antarctica]
MNKQRMLTLMLATTLLGLAPVISLAAQQERPKGPPPEAIEACKGKQADDKVSFEGRGEILDGICKEHDGKLVAMPASGRPPKRE